MFYLAPSKIHGVGVFTDRSIRADELLQLIEPRDWRFIEEPRDEDEQELCDHYCVWDGDGYHCPKSWTRMSVGWYLNDSDLPNLTPEGFQFRARRPIRAGEELTIDYDAL